MATTRRSVSPETLQRRWSERCQQGIFSPAVLGVGTIRVFGRSGDAPVTFPRIASLAALDTLEADERWAVEVAQGLVTAAHHQSRLVMATQPPQAGAAPSPTAVDVFDPQVENMLILSLTRGSLNVTTGEGEGKEPGMPRSLAHGDYRLVMAVESASRANSWYRVLIDHHTGQLSCDCPAWTFRQAAGPVNTGRSCKHSHIAQLLINPAGGVHARLAGQPVERASGAAAETHPLIQATRQQWPGLGGRWSFEQRTSTIDDQPYHFVLLHLTTGNGTNATGLVAFARRYHLTTESMVAGVAGWAGYAIAADIARSAGYALAGQPPEHFKVTRRTTTAGGRLGLADILRVGDQVDLGDGYTPVQRAENTLRLFLGDSLYAQLEQQHFLDVSSVRYASERRVYRVRRDPARLRERRVRVFTNGRYVQDLCIVRGQDIPEADHWLTVFLSLLSDEERALSVVQRYNIFPPHSDDYYEKEEETIPAVWRPGM